MESKTNTTLENFLKYDTKGGIIRRHYALGDYQKEFSLHPDWQGRSSAEMSRDAESGACAFMQALYQYIRSIAKSESERKAMLNTITTIKPKKQRVCKWSSFKTMEDWMNYYGKHPEWKNKGTRHNNEKFKSFYGAFSYFLKKNLPESQIKQAKQAITSPKKERTHFLELEEELGAHLIYAGPECSRWAEYDPLEKAVIHNP